MQEISYEFIPGLLFSMGSGSHGYLLTGSE